MCVHDAKTTREKKTKGKLIMNTRKTWTQKFPKKLVMATLETRSANEILNSNPIVSCTEMYKGQGKYSSTICNSTLLQFLSHAAFCINFS